VRRGKDLSFLKNKHLLIATLTAPILGLLSYFAVDHFVGEKPHAAEAGQSYVLVEKPNCRRSSGNCGLKNGAFELNLSYERPDGGRLLLQLKSEFPLDGVMIAMGASDSEQDPPEQMQRMDNDNLNWSLNIANPDPEYHRLYLVASSGQSFYYGDVATKFTLKH
jgi:hypothetical protein